MLQSLTTPGDLKCVSMRVGSHMSIVVPPRYHTVQPHDHIRLAAALGSTDPAKFDFLHDSAFCKRIRQGLHGDVKMKNGCVLCSDVLIRGDLGAGSVDMGKFVAIGESVLLRPPVRLTDRGGADIVPLSIGEHVFIGKHCVVEASRVGSCVVIESDCILGPNSEVHHGVWLKSHSVVPRDAKLMPFGVYEGNPARLVGQIHPDAGLFEMRELVLDVIRRTGLLADA
jgi:carbonic anhydrase/acetyltransferase-like protein (isoleucine patch superfamily)